MKKWLLALMICLSFSTLTVGIFLLPKTINIVYQREQNAEEDSDAGQSALNYNRYDWTSTVIVKTITLSMNGYGAVNSPTTTLYANSCQDVYHRWRLNGEITPLEYSYQNDDLVKAKGPVLPTDQRELYLGDVVHFAKISLSGITTRTNTAWESTDSSYVMPATRGYFFAGYWSASSGGTQYISATGSITTAGINACIYGSGGSTTWYAQWAQSNEVIKLYPYTTAPDNGTIETSTWLSSFTLQASPSGKSQWKTISASYVYTASEFNVPRGWDIRFRANCNSGYAVWKIMYNSSRVWPDADGYYTISSLSSSTSGTYYFYPLAGYKVSVTAGTGGTVQHQTSSPKMASISGGVKSSTSFTATSSGNWYVSNWSNYIDIYARANTGYTFDYFSPSTSSGTVTSSKSVYAYFKANKYQLTLNPNSGIGSTQTIYAMYNSAGLYANSTPKDYASASITLPTRVGYSFGGWQTSGGVKVIDASNNLVANTSYTNSSRQWTYTSALTLYAKWTTNTYTLTFNANGGSVSSATKTVTYGTTLTNLPTPTRSGYNFKGWYYDVTGSNYVNYGRYYMYTDRVSVHVMVYMSNWSTLPADTSFISSTEGGGWTIYENADHKMAFDAFDSGVGYKTAVASRSATNLSSGWHTFDLVFNGTCVKGYIDGALVATGANFTSGNMGYPSSNSIFVGAESASDAWTPANTTFNGYVGNVIIRNNDTLSTGTEYNTITAPAQNATLYARWENATFTTTFDGNGGQADIMQLKSNLDGSFESYSNNTSIGLQDQTGGSTFVASTAQHYAGSKSLKVNYVAGGNNRFYSIGGLLSGSTYKFMAKVYIPSSSNISSVQLHTEKYGGSYTDWSGAWSTSTVTKGSWIALSCEETSAIMSDTNLYAFFNVSGSGIFYIDDWQIVSSKTNKSVVYGLTYGTLPSVAVKTGYTFKGWYTASSGGSQVTSSTTVTNSANHTIYAQWTINSYTLTAYANGGSVSSSAGWTGTGNSATKTLNYAASYNTLPTVSRSNYSLKGWYTSSSGGSAVSSTTTIGAGNANIYAQWNAIGRTITLKGRIVGKDGNVINADNLGGSRLTGTYTSVSNGLTSSGTINQSNASVAYDMHQGSTLTITPTVAGGYKYLGYSTSASSKPSVSSFPTSSSITVPTSNTTYYFYFQEVAAPLYYTTERGGYWYYEDGEYPQTYVGTSLSGASATSSKFNINGTDYTVYTANGSKYIQVQAPNDNNGTIMTTTIKFNGTTATITEGQYYWFRIDPIRWRVSEYGASASKYSASQTISNFVGVSDILGYGRIHNGIVTTGQSPTPSSTSGLSNYMQDCPAVGYTNADVNLIHYTDSLAGDNTSTKVLGVSNITPQKRNGIDQLIVATIIDIQNAAHNGIAQDNLKTYASDLSAMLQCRDYNNSTGWTSSIYNQGSGVTVGPGSSYMGKYWANTDNVFGFVYIHQASDATCLGTR